MIVVLLFLVAVGISTLAVEGGLWYVDRHDLRAMADSAVISAGWGKHEGDDLGVYELTAKAAAEELGFDDTNMDEIEVNSPPTSGIYEDDDAAVEVIITRVRPLMLSSLFVNATTVTISVRAVAADSYLSEACVLALDPDDAGAISVSGNGDVSLSGCGLMANSNDDAAISVGGNGTLAADYLATAGGTSNTGSAVTSVNSTVTETEPMADPFASITPSPPAACTYDSQWRDNDGKPPAGSRFCDGMKIQGDLDLDPGTYYITGGDLDIGSQANVTGSGVTFVLTGTASVKINGGAEMNISAPTSGTYNGLLFFSTSTGGGAIINGGSTMNLDGALYFKEQSLDFKGNNETSGGCLRIVAKTVSISGSSGMGGDCDQYGLPSFAPFDTVSLVE